MLSTRRVFLTTCVCVLVSASTALANGGGNGGAKRDATIRILNLVPGQIGVAVGNVADHIESEIGKGNITNAAQFKAAGGTILNVDQKGDFKVREGAHSVIALRVSPAGVIGGTKVPVAQGGTRLVAVYLSGIVF